MPSTNFGTMDLDSQNIIFCFGSRYECFYSNIDSGKCKTLPKGKPNVNSGLLKGLDKVIFLAGGAKTWIDNNRVDHTSSGCTLLWNNRNVMSKASGARLD